VKELYQLLNILQTNADIGQGVFAQWIEACAPPKSDQPEKIWAGN